MREWLSEKNMTAYSFLSGDHHRINIDVLAGASLSFSDYASRKVTIDLEKGLKVPVIALDDLLAMKREANRSQDLLDIEMLLDYRLHE